MSDILPTLWIFEKKIYSIDWFYSNKLIKYLEKEEDLLKNIPFLFYNILLKFIFLLYIYTKKNN
jgi:hypothetical protein